MLGLNGTDHNKVSLKFLEGIRRLFSSLRNFKNFSSLAYLAINLLFILSRFAYLVISCLSLFPSDAAKFSLTMDAIMVLRTGLCFNGRFCLYAASGIINKVNQQNKIRRLKLVPRINAATSLGALCLISVVPLKSGSVKGQIFHCAC